MGEGGEGVFTLASAIYVALSFGAALYISYKVKKRFFAFLVCFWILAHPVILYKFSFKIPVLNSDFNMNRILFIYFVIIMLFGMADNEGKKFKLAKPSFEIYVLLFMLMVSLSLGYNSNALGVKRSLALSMEVITFVLIYFSLKKYILEDSFRAIIKTIVLLAVINSFLCLYQLLVDTQFLRMAVPRRAFGNYFRSFGTYGSEYTLAIVQMVSLYVVIIWYKGKKIRFYIVTLIVISVMTTFHRLDIIILAVTLMVYIKYYSTLRSKILVLVGVVSIVAASIPVFQILLPVVGESEFVKERLAQDTVSGRFKQYEVVINEIPKYPLGLGNYENRIYQELMIKNKMTESVYNPKTGETEPKGLPVHNGYLSIAMQHGVITAFLFIMFLYTAFRYFKNKVTKKYPISIVPMFAVIVWALSNISNAIIVFRSYEVMLIAILLGAYSGLYSKGYMRDSIR